MVGQIQEVQGRQRALGNEFGHLSRVGQCCYIRRVARLDPRDQDRRQVAPDTLHLDVNPCLLLKGRQRRLKGLQLRATPDDHDGDTSLLGPAERRQHPHRKQRRN